VLRWTGAKPTTALQEKAREARYRLIAAAAGRARAACVLTAHTIDDQAETVLIRLTRASGLTGLAGMARVRPLFLPAPAARAKARDRDPGPAASVFLVRPFLDIPKSRLVATLREAGIACADDPSNRDPRFTRARLRALMPALAREGLDAHRFALLAQRIRRAEAAIELAVGAAASALSAAPWSAAGPIAFDGVRFAGLPAEVALRLLGRAITQAGNEGPVELGKLESLADALAAAQAGSARFRRTLAGAVVTLQGDRLTIERAPARRNRRDLPNPESPAGRKAGKARFTKGR